MNRMSQITLGVHFCENRSRGCVKPIKPEQIYISNGSGGRTLVRYVTPTYTRDLYTHSSRDLYTHSSRDLYTVCPEAAKSNFGDICFLDKFN